MWKSGVVPLAVSFPAEPGVKLTGRASRRINVNRGDVRVTVTALADREVALLKPPRPPPRAGRGERVNELERPGRWEEGTTPPSKEKSLTVTPSIYIARANG